MITIEKIEGVTEEDLQLLADDPEMYRRIMDYGGYLEQSARVLGVGHVKELFQQEGEGKLRSWLAEDLTAMVTACAVLGIRLDEERACRMVRCWADEKRRKGS